MMSLVVVVWLQAKKLILQCPDRFVQKTCERVLAQIQSGLVQRELNVLIPRAGNDDFHDFSSGSRPLIVPN